MAIRGFAQTVQCVLENPVWARNERAIAELELAVAKPDGWEFITTTGGAPDGDSLRGFGATAQMWRNGKVVILDDNCFPLRIAVELDGRRWRPAKFGWDKTKYGWLPTTGEGWEDYDSLEYLE